MWKNMTPKQIMALEVMLSGGTVQTAAQAADVSRATVYRWLNSQDFSAKLQEAESEALSRLSRRLIELGNQATSALSDALEKSTQINYRLRAAAITLSRLLAIRDLHDLDVRIAKLEEIQNGQNYDN
jgi:transposase